MASPTIAHRKEEILDLLDRFRQRPALAPPADEPRVKARAKADPPPAAQSEVEPLLRRASRREKQLRSARAAVDRLLEDSVPVESVPPPPSVVPVARRLLPAPRAATSPTRRPPPRRAEAPAPDRGSAERVRARARRGSAERGRTKEARPRPRRAPGPPRARATESPDPLEEPMLLALLALLALQLW